MTERSDQYRLVIGRLPENTGGVLSNADRCDGIFEGLIRAQKNDYDAIYLVLADIPEPRQKALEALADLVPRPSRYLLVNMVEEPQALALIQASNGRMLVADYFLLPLGNEFPAPTEAVDAAGADVRQMTADRKDRLIAELQKLVTQDDLTGLKNRRYLRQFLPAILDSANQAGHQVTLLLFDLDNFKHYNDTYGHSIGDAVLRETGRLMRRCCRGHDVVARLGGDEFAVVFWDLPEVPHTQDDRRGERADHPRQAQFMAERFRREMSEAQFECLGTRGKGNLTISGGLATFPRDAQTPQDLYEKADQAMLQAKTTGKNKITIVGKTI